jgi:hypothetical protein
MPSRSMVILLVAAPCSVLILLGCGNTGGPKPPSDEAGSSGEAGSENGGDAGSAGSAGVEAGGIGGGVCSTQRVVAARIALNGVTGCAIDSTGVPRCWGANLSASAPGVPNATLLQISAQAGVYGGVDGTHRPTFWGDGLPPNGPIPPGTFDQLTVNGSIACAIASCGSIACWPNDPKLPANAPAGSFQQVAAGFKHVCALDDGGLLKCWGDNTYGQTAAPTGTFSFVVSGESHSCAIASDGHIACWGAGSKLPNDNGVNNGQAIPPAGTFKYLAAGGLHTCGIKDDDTVACWGLGTTVGDCAAMAQCGQAMPPADKFQQLAGGDTNTCGIRLDGSLACWGSNTGGRSTPPADFK